MRGNMWLEALARLEPGMSPDQMAAQLTDASRRIAKDNGRESTDIVTVTPFWKSSRGAQGVLGPVLLVLMAMVAIVLLIACANIANLLLSRSSARTREFALRLSLGCGRGRLIRQLLTESLVLVSFAAVAAIAMQMWTAGALMWLMPPNNFPIGFSLTTFNWPVLAFTAAAAFGSAVIFGLVPALQAGRTDLVTHLKADARVAGGGRVWLRHTLVVSQIAFALLLLISAGLFLRSLSQAKQFDFGFKADHVLIGSVDLYSAGYDPARGTRFLDEVLGDIRAMPGVEAASVARRVPLGISTGSSTSSIEPEGYVAPKDNPASASFAWVGADYFKVMRIPVRAGREFRSTDRPDDPPVIIVNQAFADRFWPGEEALGKRVRYGRDWMTVAGVVANSKYRRLEEASTPFIYQSTTWSYRPDVVFHVRTQTPPEAFADTLRAAVRRADPALPVYGVMTLGEHVEAASIQQRLAASMLSVFGGLALLLATVGLYASMAYTVSRRTRELGARLALGATPTDITRLVLGQAFRLIGTGVAIGLALALGAAQLFSSLLFGVRPFDLATFAGVAALLAAVAAIASYLPARRASRLDPLTALRVD
jgi:predicted permease